MKRKGYIIEEITEYGNLYESLRYVLRGRVGETQEGRRLLDNAEAVIASLQQEIGAGTYHISEYHEFKVDERGKERTIQSVPLRDRIALNAIMKVLEKHLNPSFVTDSAASIKGRGGHYLFKRMVDAIQSDPQGTCFVYKWDYRHYYQSIPQDKMFDVLKRKFKDPRLLRIMWGVIHTLKEGLSIGFRSSQVLGNLYLDYYIDHRLKDEMAVKYYFRYCDDGVVLAGSYKELTCIIRKIHEFSDAAALTIKGNEQVWELRNRNIDFLGFVYHANGQVKVRKHIKKRFARRWKRVIGYDRKVKLIGAFYGVAKHADARHLFNKITGYDMTRFSELGLGGLTKEGKKMFETQTYTLTALNGIDITLLDFETHIKTQHGEERCVVYFTSAELGEGKFFTSSGQMISQLEQMRERGVFPVETTIKRINYGGNKYKFIFT